jgi:secreted trypsin-like serine protease
VKRALVAALALVVLAVAAAPAEAVVGGRTVRASDYPWFATLPDCGGSLIAPDRIVTAAHCVWGLRLSDLSGVRVGGRRRAVARMAVAPGFVRELRSGDAVASAAPPDDVAILQLAAPVEGIAPVAIASSVRTGSRARVLGRGLTRAPRRAVGAQDGSAPLRAASLRVLSDRSCRAFYRRRGGSVYRSAFRPAGMLCAGDADFPRPTPSACVRDSGGPLVARRARAWTLLGTVSWGLRCGAEGDPTVFTDVPRARAFVTAAEPVWAPSAGEQPATVTGDARVGGTLTCAAPPFDQPAAEVEYRWTSYRFQRGNVVRQESSSTSYAVRGEDAGRLILCTAIGYTAGGSSESRPSAGARIPAPGS